MRTNTDKNAQTVVQTFDDKLQNLRHTFNQKQQAEKNVSLFIDGVKKIRRKKRK